MGRKNRVRKKGKAAMTVQFDKTGQWMLDGRYWVRLSDGFRLPVIQGSGPANLVQNDKYEDTLNNQ